MEDELLSALEAIDPASLDYQQWCDVGMALQGAGADVSVWDGWSARDGARYHPGECARKWRGFGERADGVTAKTVYRMAYDAGWTAPKREGTGYGWNDAVELAPERQVRVAPVTATTVDARDVGEVDVPTGAPADRMAEIADYLRALFREDEHVGYVTDEVRQDEDGKWKPAGKGQYRQTRDELLSSLAKYPTDPGWTFGDANAQAGAWVRINPLDGEGASDGNVTDWRYALVESDAITPGKQLALIREMRLPVAAIVTSGGKSVHAIVHVDAADKGEYRERVRALYEYCRASGFPVDEQNRNPSRLSRLPGYPRGNGWQRLVQAGPGEGPRNWDEWQDWVTEQATGLPEIQNIGAIAELPELAPQLIHGVMRDGQKGMLVGPSKSGKSFALIELAIAVARGWEWMGHGCSRGRVMYVNMEIQRESFSHRIADVYRAMKLAHGEDVNGGWESYHDELADLDAWTLRGHGAPLDRLVPMLVRRCADRGYRLVIIDPIYKVLTGDENSASDMALFTNQFDVICSELGCAVFYAHHHAKGEAGRRASVDRASGSGVFARDPDAMLDMSPLAVPAAMRDSLRYEVEGTDGEMHERHGLAYRVSYTLREFETPPPCDIVFRWPLHERTDELSSCRVVGEEGEQQTRTTDPRNKTDRAERWEDINAIVAEAVESVSAEGEPPTVQAVAAWLAAFRPADCERLSVDERALGKWSKPSQRERNYPRFGFEKCAGETGAYILAPVS